MDNTNKFFWIMIMLAILVLGVLSFILKPSFFEKIWKKSPPAVNTNNGPVITLAQTKIILEAQSPFYIPDSSTSTKITINELGGDVSQFILPGAINTDINKEKFSDGTTGFSITYEVSKNIRGTYGDFVSFSNKSPFKIAYASVANLATLITTESINYRVKVLAEKVEENLSKVVIQIQKK